MKRHVNLSRFFLKLIALCLSILIWIFVLNSERIEVEKNISVEYLLPNGFEVTNILPHDFTIQIEGPRAFVRNFPKENNPIILNLTQKIKRSGQMTIYLDSRLFNAPLGLNLIKITPSKIVIDVEKK
jgi:YbbR domain-containing protein